MRAFMAVLLPMLVVGVVWCLSATAGMYSPPGGDSPGQWLSNSVIVFTGVDPRTGFFDGIRTVDVDASPPQERLIAPHGMGLRVSPNTQFLAFQLDIPQRPLVVASSDGSSQRTVFPNDAVAIGWLGDSSRLVLRAPDYQGASAPLYSVRPDGSDLTEYPANVHGIPSPDGSLFADGFDGALRLVTADGLRTTTLEPAAAEVSNPVWSPDGKHLAFWATNALAIPVIGGPVRYFDVGGSNAAGGIVWSPDGHVVYAQTASGAVSVDPVTGAHRLLPGVSSVGNVSPDGTRLAYLAGGECRDRNGNYVVSVDGQGGGRRVSNSCRIVGTDGPDVLHGSFSQVVVGLGGDDSLYADDTYYFFDGDTLYGGPGNDKLVGGFARDIIYGGPGNDTLTGGGSIDILIGGPGHDHISGGGGNDVIGAQDGERDWISCGTDPPNDGIPDRDVVYADKIDVVAADCEIVHRR